MISVRTSAWALALLIAGTSASVVQATPAKLPSPEDSEIPCGINLVGTRDGVADPHGEFTIVLRDFARNPVFGCAVTIDFCACAGSPSFCLAGSQPDPDVLEVSPDCCRVTGFTNTGTLQLTLVGHAASAPGPACPPVVYADGISFAYSSHPDIIVGAFDLDGGQGVAPPDLSLWLGDAFAPQYRARADYDCSGTVTPADLARWLEVSLAGDSQVSAANTVCH